MPGLDIKVKIPTAVFGKSEEKPKSPSFFGENVKKIELVPSVFGISNTESKAPVFGVEVKNIELQKSEETQKAPLFPFMTKSDDAPAKISFLSTV